MKLKKGCTLIELLVVVSIIAMLLSIMMPALSKAREAARCTVCKSNLYQLGITFMVYAGSNDTFLPRVDNFDTTHNHNNYRGLWNWDPGMRNILRDDYGFERKSWYCPSLPQLDGDIYWQPEATGSSPQVVVSYIYTAYLGAKCPQCGKWYADASWANGPRPHPWHPMKRTFDKGSATQVLAADAIHYHITGDAWRGGHRQHGRASLDWLTGEPSGANELFGDGHVEWRAVNEMLERRVEGSVVQFMW